MEEEEEEAAGGSDGRTGRGGTGGGEEEVPHHKRRKRRRREETTAVMHPLLVPSPGGRLMGLLPASAATSAAPLGWAVAVAVEWTPTAKSIRVSPALRRRRLERHRPALQRVRAICVGVIAVAKVKMVHCLLTLRVNGVEQTTKHICAFTHQRLDESSDPQSFLTELADIMVRVSSLEVHDGGM